MNVKVQPRGLEIVRREVGSHAQLLSKATEDFATGVQEVKWRGCRVPPVDGEMSWKGVAGTEGGGNQPLGQRQHGAEVR